MNKIKKSLAVPRCVLIAPYKVMSWLYQPLMPLLRERHGTAFVLLLPESTDLEAQYRPFLGEGDQVVTIPGFDEMAASRRKLAGRVDELALARCNEDKYQFGLLQDVIQQERPIVGGYVDQAIDNIFKTKNAPSMDTLAGTVNGYIETFDALFDRFPIDMALIWPRTAMEATGAIVASHRGVLVTYPYTAKHKNFAYWASGPFASGLQHLRAYDTARVSRPVEPHEIEPPGRPADLQHDRFDTRYSFGRMLKEIARNAFFYLEFFLIDLRNGSLGKTRRRPMRQVFGKIISDWRYYRRFVRLCERDVGRLSEKPYLFFAFQIEPEFSVQARCKEFNDQRAIVRQLSLCLPADMNLVIKEHAFIGDRHLSFYEDLVALPNVVMAHPGIPALDLIKRSKAVASLAGTVTLEAAMHGKSALIFTERSEFRFLPNVLVVRSFNKMWEQIREVVAPKSQQEVESFKVGAARLREAIERIGVDAEAFYTKMSMDVAPEVSKRAADLLIDLFRLHQSEATKGNARLEL